MMIDNEELVRRSAERSVAAPSERRLEVDARRLRIVKINRMMNVSLPLMPWTVSGVRYLQDIGDDTKRLRMTWAVKHFIAMGTTSTATGKWGAGKTAVFIDIGMHIAFGLPWRGRKVKQGVVLHVALENPYDVERRVAALKERMRKADQNVNDAAYVIYTEPCTLFEARGAVAPDEGKIIKAAMDASEYYGFPVAMIVIDTLSQAMGSGDDNSATDAKLFVDSMQRIAVATGAHVVALAHPPKSGPGVRGSGVFQANVDTVVAITYDKVTKVGTIKADGKFRIGDPSKVNFTYRMESAVVGTDDDGEVETVVLAVETRSMAVDEDGDAARFKVADDARGSEEAVFSVLTDMIDMTVSDGEDAATIWIRQRDLLTQWNRWRADRDDMEGVALKSRDDRQLIRVLDRLVAAERVKRTRGKPAKIGLFSQLSPQLSKPH
jgi:hypothetical protein